MTSQCLKLSSNSCIYSSHDVQWVKAAFYDAFFKIIDGHTLLHCAAMHRQNSVIKHWYSYTDIPDKIGQKGHTPPKQFITCKESQVNIAKHLIERCHSDPLYRDENNNTPLQCAAYSGNLELVNYLTDNHHCDVNTRGQ